MSHPKRLIWLVITGLAAAFCSPLPAVQQTGEQDLFELDIEALFALELTGAVVRNLGLNDRPLTANPFGLTSIELPLSIDVIDRNTMRARGLKSVTEAADNLVGVISGESPAEPSSFSMRGFIRDSVTILRDGIRLGPASMTMRPQNTFNLQQIEIVKGPATLQYGHGSASGFINMITRKPQIGQQKGVELFASNATYNSHEWGLGLTGPVGQTSAYRLDINQAKSRGWVDRTDSKSLNVTASVLWQPYPTVDMLLSYDYLKDDLPAYWGTPLVPATFSDQPLGSIIQTDDGRVLDKSMRFTNFNVADNRSDSNHLWTRWQTSWQAQEQFEISNTLYYFEANRAWQNAESYLFNADNAMIERDRFFVFHDHRFIGNQLSLSTAHNIGRYPNSLALTVDYNKTDFLRQRGFPEGDSVSPVNPLPGQFGPLEQHASPTLIESWSLNLEDRLQLTPYWHLFAGIRADNTHLVRDNFNPQGQFIAEDSFSRTFNPFSYHVNTSYQLDQNHSLYFHWSTAHDPVGSNIYLVNAMENFKFTDIRQFEAGYKAIVEPQKLEWTLAYFDIKRSNILLLLTHDTVGNVGIQTGRGLELALSVQPQQNLRLGGNIAYNHARYTDFTDPDFAVNASGNAPPNVPRFIANAWISQSQVADLPIEIGGGIRYVSNRFTNFENTVSLNSQLTLSLFAAYNFADSRISINVRNATNQDYAPWADIFYANQLAIASPRTLEISFVAEF